MCFDLCCPRSTLSCVCCVHLSSLGAVFENRKFIVFSESLVPNNHTALAQIRKCPCPQAIGTVGWFWGHHLMNASPVAFGKAQKLCPKCMAVTQLYSHCWDWLSLPFPQWHFILSSGHVLAKGTILIFWGVIMLLLLASWCKFFQVFHLLSRWNRLMRISQVPGSSRAQVYKRKKKPTPANQLVCQGVI